MMKIVEQNPIKTVSLKRLASGLIIFWGPFTKSHDFLTTQCVYPQKAHNYNIRYFLKYLHKLMYTMP